MFTKNTSKEDGTEPRLNIIMLRIFEQITEKCSSYSSTKKSRYVLQFQKSV